MKDRIWELFILRVNQEERVQADQKALRYLNAYYAVCAATAAVLGALYPAAAWNVLLAVMTILLALLTVFLCANPLEARLRMIRRDLAELEKLHTEAGAEMADEMAVLSRLQLIVSSGAGVSAQERRSYERAKDRSEEWQAAYEGRSAEPHRLFGYENFLYWLIEIVRIVLMAFAILLPAAGFALAACGLL